MSAIFHYPPQTIGIALAPNDAKIREDLGTVITLQGKPCDEVVSIDRLGDDEYVATCNSGDRYRVYVGTGDRVIVEKRDKD